MVLTEKFLNELQKRLKIGNRRGVHLNALPGSSRYKFDFTRLAHIEEGLPQRFLDALLSQQPLKFRISWKDNVPDLNLLFEEEQIQLARITKAFENLINQTDAIESEKGVNTFGFGFPLLVRRDRADNKLTVAPILIWSLRIKRTKEFNTWEIQRNDDDPIYINEVLINHLQNDVNIEIGQIPNDMLDDGLISKDELVDICCQLIRNINTTSSNELEATFRKKLDAVAPINDKAHYEKLPLNATNSLIEFGGLFSIFEVQKQNIINDYNKLLALSGQRIETDDLTGNSFQSISSIQTDPSQQGILNSLEYTRNVLIQGPPGTGKSQTLTAILINALENNKRTIVVCEKRTALEVLYEALVKKGLGYSCILIRDIVKDRRAVVDSVRDRIDNSEYRKYRYDYSKESLDDIVERATMLIDSINKKHQKIDTKLIGNQTWSDIVGQLLKELRRLEDDIPSNKFKNADFNYTSEELKEWIDLVKNGQRYYNSFYPIAEKAFLNPQKLTGDAPFVIEENLKNDFENYEAQVRYLETTLTEVKAAYEKKRNAEIQYQISEIETRIEKLSALAGWFEHLVATSKRKFIDARQNEFTHQVSMVRECTDFLLKQDERLSGLIVECKKTYDTKRKFVLNDQILKIERILSPIDTLIERNRGNQDFISEKKLNSIGYKILAFVSSKRKQTLADYASIKALLGDLERTLEDCADIDMKIPTNAIGQKIASIEPLRNSLKETAATFSIKTDKEYSNLELNLISELQQDHLLPIQDAFEKSRPENKEILEGILLEFHFFLTKLNEVSKNLNRVIELGKDLPKDIKLSGPLCNVKPIVTDILHNIKLKELNFEESLETEFLDLRLNDVLSKENNHLIHAYAQIPSMDPTLAETVKTICKDFEEYISKINVAFRELADHMLGAKDIKLNIKFNRSYLNNKVILEEIKPRIAKIVDEIDNKIQAEFALIDLLNTDPARVGIDSLIQLQQGTVSLVEKFNSDAWLKTSIKFKSFQSIIEQANIQIDAKNAYFDQEQDYFSIEFKWFQYYNALSEFQRLVVDELKQTRHWERVFMIIYLNAVLIKNGDINLPTDDQAQVELNEVMGNVEKEQLKYIKEFWYSKQIDATKQFQENNNGLSVENLYNKRSSPQNRRLSLRQIVQKDANLFTTFFPIILTSPDVASNLFKGMNGYFDIVMFDEASQLRIEDNLPAILKGRQVIIAGDEHQMPPSNYFSKVFDGSIEDDTDLEEEDEIKYNQEDSLLNCESLLDFGAELNFDKKHLDFHYRSRHPFLIDFSNYAFYNQRLKPLPNSFDYIPIKYIQVDGTFSDHVNDSEAEMVISIIEHNIHRLPNGKYPSLGIATFNIAQRDLIKSKILQRLKLPKYAEFNTKIQELEENGMFVKNLENIQGDERDVIILSTTYGKGQAGNFAQRFGPINYQKGYRLLNVIITRAKYKVYCCTSVPEENFLNYKDFLFSEGSNNKRGAFYAYLAYCKAVSESDHQSRLAVLTTLAENTARSVSLDPRDLSELESPFEEEVYQVLIDHFGPDKVTPQLKFGGFRIDIVYDPKLPGVKKIAIECDGATFHSSNEAYLHDIHRQKILENHGFVFHRIWSTNWWRSHRRETERLINFIREVEQSSLLEVEDDSLTSLAFTDDVKMVEQYVVKDMLAQRGKETKEFTQAAEQEIPVQVDEYGTSRVKEKSKVVVKYLNNGKSLKIRLVQTQHNKPAAKNDFQDLYHRSPLAVSLQGHSVGDIVKIGELDNFVEILEIA